MSAEKNENAEKKAQSPAAKAESTEWKSVSGVGIACDRNARFRRTMEDSHKMIDEYGGDESCGYFAVYDGHGGRQVVDFVEKHLHQNMLDAMKEKDSMEEAWKAAYLATDEAIAENKITFSGTTVCSVVVRKETKDDTTTRMLYSANAGDARNVLIRDGKGVRLTYDHKASDEAEGKRIAEAGGFIMMNRVNGMLAVTRALGDQTMKDYVTSEPYCESHQLTEKDTHVIVACDGIWDVLSDQDAADLVLSMEKDGKSLKQIARRLLVKSIQGGSTDNISVMVVKL